MPKQVDHHQRRQEIADAVCRLVAAHGLHEVSLRHVADEAGVSMGQVQHYFNSKDEMLLFAFQTLSERVEARIGAAVREAPQPPTQRAILSALLREMLPLGEQARAEAPVWVAFLARAIVEPRLAVPFHQDGRALYGFVGDQIRSAQHAGVAPAMLDPDREANTLLALADGMMIQMLVGQLDISDALATLDYHLDRIFTGDGRGSREVSG
ncbi:MAG: TetR/AcrR family transcriptional regulator [Streptosporangiaceae bacterium]